MDDDLRSLRNPSECMQKRMFLALFLLLGWMPGPLRAQNGFPDGHLDPTRNIPQTEAHSPHAGLPEEYIWTAGDAAALHPQNHYSFAHQNEKAGPHYFRATFKVKDVPSVATLYVAGPRSAIMFVNGRKVGEVSSDLTSPLGIHVYTTDVTKALRAGNNTIALQVVRGTGIVSVDPSPVVKQQTFGEILAVKIVPAAAGVFTAPILISDGSWKSQLAAPMGWEQPSFDDSAWDPVQTLGPVESSIDMFQWNADAGMYDWPGYDGASSFLRHYSLQPETVTHIFLGRSHFENLAALTTPRNSTMEISAEFTVKPATKLLPDEEAPSLLLDFGREVAGRVELQLDCDCDALVTIQYGESEEEAILGGDYLGINLLRVPAYGVAYGPKSGFRYVKIRFVGGAPQTRFKAIQLDGIEYPVDYEGSFQSSDPLLNRIWETGAYTMHLCMQDDIWDAVKRDRGRWIGDLDVGGHVVNAVFADHFLMEDTMTRLIGKAPVTDDVNGIPGYSALWVTSLADYYRHTGSKNYLRRMHPRLVELLRFMDSGFDSKNLFVNPGKKWLFVDWSPGLYADTPAARRATEIEFYRAYREGAYLLREVGDNSTAEHYEQRATALKTATDKYLLDPATQTYGMRWQTNAMAILSGLATPAQYPAIWSKVLFSVGQEDPDAPIISPYYNYYVVTALAESGHRQQALDWIRKYWGGMLAEGATSFWESYDLRWPKNHFHESLQADGTSGFYVSLAHGWSSGPTAWLMEQVLGIQPTGAGFSSVTIRPDLIDLQWVKGAEPTPHGLIVLELKKQQGTAIILDIPAGVDAQVLVPIMQSSAKVYVNGATMRSTLAEKNQRASIHLDRAGHYTIEAH